jgi:hypothetical protein
MELRDYTIPRAKVPLPGKPKPGEEKSSFEVRGLCVDDLTFLVTAHHGPITRALKLYQESRSDILASKNISGFVLTLAKDFPDLVAEVISAATDSLDDQTREIARKLPIVTQITALNEILKLSMEEAGGLKNLMAEIRARIESARDGVK